MARSAVVVKRQKAGGFVMYPKQLVRDLDGRKLSRTEKRVLDLLVRHSVGSKHQRLERKP